MPNLISRQERAVKVFARMKRSIVNSINAIIAAGEIAMIVATSVLSTGTIVTLTVPNDSITSI